MQGDLRMSAVGRLVTGLAGLWLGAFAFEAAAQEVAVDAVWKPQRATFNFMGQTTRYACDELERRLREVLVVLGAHEEMHIDRRECSPYTGMRLHITFMSPIEATPDNVRALTTFDSEDQLVARLRGIELPTAEDVLPFPAEWQAISLSRDQRLNLRAGDCELMEQIRRQLLPRFATRDVSKRLVCSPGNLSARPPPLNVSALVASAQ
jgi:hypothetical protein